MRSERTQPSGSRLLQPLKEVGLTQKTQCWDIEEIQAALREAYVSGVSVESLYGTGSKPTQAVQLGRIVKPTLGPKPVYSRNH
jgi:hypothetical protein